MDRIVAEPKLLLLSELRHSLERFVSEFPEGRETFRARLNEYIELERNHINKEEGELMPLARERLSEEDWVEIDRAFADNADPLFGETTRSDFRLLHRHIAELAPIPHGLGMEHPAPSVPAPATTEPVLEITDLTSHYGSIQTLQEIGLRILPGDLVSPGGRQRRE